MDLSKRVCDEQTGFRGLERWQLIFCLLMLVSSYLSIAISQITLGLTLALMLMRWAVCRRRPATTGLETATFLLAGWALFTIPFSTDPGQSIVFYRRFYLFAAIWTGASLATTEHRRLVMAWCLIAGALIISLYGQVRALIIDGSLFKFRMGEISNPMTSGAMLMMVILVAIAFLLTRGHSRKLKLWIGLATLPVAVGFIQTMTRSAFLGFIPALVLMVLVTRPRLTWLVVAAVIAMVGFVVVAGEETLPPTLWLKMNPQNIVSGVNTTSRIEMWAGGLQIIRDHPIVGTGDRDLTAIGPLYFGGPDTIYHGHLHNNFVQMAVIWGLPGLIFGILFLLAPLRIVIRRWRHFNRAKEGEPAPPVLRSWVLALLGVWLSMFIAGFTEWYFGDAETMLVYLTILGIAAGSWPTDAGFQPAPPESE